MIIAAKSWIDKIKEALGSPFVYSTLALLLLAELVWQTGALLGSTLQQPEPPLLPKVRGAVVVQTQQSPVLGQRLFLFGRPPQEVQTKATAEPEMQPSVQKTRLNLKLIGLVNLGSRGVALIQKGGQTLVLVPGETIQPGVKLLKLLPNQVIIEHNGRQERLMLQGAEEKVEPQGRSASDPRAAVSVDQQKLNHIVQRLRHSPMAISQYLRFQPLRRNNQWVGVQIWPKTEPKLFRALGFKPGDIIRQVDGRTIQQMSEQPQLWQKFTQQSQFELLIDRQGSTQVLSIDLNPPGGFQ